MDPSSVLNGVSVRGFLPVALEWGGGVGLVSSSDPSGTAPSLLSQLIVFIDLHQSWLSAGVDPHCPRVDLLYNRGPVPSPTRDPSFPA